ncbi:hypothetical protein [Wolbachia endosymbiont (group E) of Neria commutata]|uniref:hypothetical protein n=1 Tax=Wolbachia endosymbiont (group E) of Neria commutata TaxID=3066149 RepID=UPI003132EA54
MNPSTLTAASNNVDNRPPCLFDQIKTGVKLKQVSDTKEAPKKSSNGSNEQGNGHMQELQKVLQARANVMCTNTSDDESEWIDYEGETSPIKTKVGNKTPESGYTSGDDMKQQEPEAASQVLPETAVNDTNQVSSGTQDPSTFSVQNRCAIFGNVVTPGDKKYSNWSRK